MSLERPATPSNLTGLEPVDFNKISSHSDYFSMMKEVVRQKSPVLRPAGTKYLDYSRKIKQGKWLEMDFNDPEAVRHIYKACEEGFINSDELVTAVLLLNAGTDFRGENDKAVIKQYRFDDTSGPYDYTKIIYAKKSNSDDFKNRLAKLPDHQRYYFEINLPHKSAMVFLYEGYVTTVEEPTLGKFNQILKAYIATQAIDEAQKAHLSDLVTKERNSMGHCTCGGCSIDPDEFITFLLEQNLSIKSYLENRGDGTSRQRCSIHFLMILVKLAEQHPAFELSSNYDLSNPESPLVSIILLTMPAFNSLTLAMHGEDATLPDYCVGKIPVSSIRKSEEFFKNGKYSQKRPVELPYPGIVSDDKPHNYPANNFMITYHDLFHIWRNGNNPLKDFARFLRQLLHREKGYYMSKHIWSLTDMDYQFGKLIRCANDKFSKISIREQFIQAMLNDIFFKQRNVFGIPVGIQDGDHIFLLLVDLIKNEKKWDKATPHLGVKELLFNIYPHAKSIYDESRDLIMQDPVKLREIRSSTYYVIKFRLRKLADGDKLCEALSTTDVVRWNRNSGLFIQPQYTKDNKKIALDTINQDDLSDVIHFALEKYNELNFVDVEIENAAARKNLNAVIRVNGKTSNLTKISEGSYRMSIFWVRECFRKIEKAQEALSQEEMANEDQRIVVKKTTAPTV